MYPYKGLPGKGHFYSGAFPGPTGAAPPTDIIFSTTFENQTSLPSGWTYTRASQAAPITGVSGGSVQVTKFASNVYAYAYNEVAARTGALVENVCTNLMTHSQNFQNAAWIKSGHNHNGNVTAPDGTNTADEYLISSGALIYQAATTVASRTYTASVFIKGTATGTLEIHDGTSSVATVAFDTSNTWQRIEVNGSHAGTTTQLRLNITSNNAVAFWGAQLETPAVTIGTPKYAASSYIETTTTTATRAHASLSHANMYTNGYVLHSAGELYMEYIPQPYRNAGRGTIWSLYGGSSNDEKFAAFNGTSCQIKNNVGTLIDVMNYSLEVDNTPVELRIAWDDTSSIDGTKNWRMVVDGVERDSDVGAFASGTTDVTLDLGDLGNSKAGAQAHCIIVLSVNIYNTAQAV